MTSHHTVGDFTLQQIGPSMFTVTSERRARVYFADLVSAERRGHELAKVDRVSLWRAEPDVPLSLIASYRR
jgi:hypothetical protein